MDNLEKAEQAAEIAAQAAGGIADSGVMGAGDTANTRKAGFWASALAGFLSFVQALKSSKPR